MPDTPEPAASPDEADRQQQIVDVLVEAFADLMAADADAFRTKFRKMAADPFAFYRGSACLFYADLAGAVDPWTDERTSRAWVHGDLHAANFGSYMDGEGRIVFDVNDYDESYLGHVSWDLRRFCASFALLAWRKALSDDAISAVLRVYLESYLAQVRAFSHTDEDREFRLDRHNTAGAVLELVLATAEQTRIGLLDRLTVVEDHQRRFSETARHRRLDDDERAEVLAAVEAYRETIPQGKRRREVTYDVKDVVGTGGFGIGSAGLPAYTVLLEGYDQALENDVVLSLKQAARAAPSRVVTDPQVQALFAHDGERTVSGQRAMQSHASPFLGHTVIRGVGFLVSELSPYEQDLDWDDLTEPAQIEEVVALLGRATAKIHCIGDADADHTAVAVQMEDAISGLVDGRDEELIADLTAFGHEYGARARADHRLFVDAFRAGRIPGISSSGDHPVS